MAAGDQGDSPTGQSIGASLPNLRWERLLRGKGRFVANLALPRGGLHAVIVRAAEAHGILAAIDIGRAQAQPGVEAVFTAADMDRVCTPWEARHGLFAGARVPAELPLATGRVRYVGEPLAIVVAHTLDAATLAAELVAPTITPLPAITDPLQALADGAEPLHPALGEADAPNLHYAATRPAPSSGGAAVEISLTLSRVSPQAMETRAIVADYDAADGTLTVHQSHQHPHMMQDVYSRLLGLPEHRVRVVCPDVGGAFGGKQQLHPDEMAVVCAAVLLARPIRFVVGRSESLICDAQARDHRITARAIMDEPARRITAMTFDDLCGIGAFGHFPRTSFGEAGMAARLIGAPYAIEEIETHTRLAFQNRPHLGHYRGVGHPIACLATEALMDAAARRVGEDPIAFRRRHLHNEAALPITTPGGIQIDRYRMGECLDALEGRLAGAARGRSGNLMHGVGVACLTELVASGPRYYGEGGVHITCDETAMIRMEPSGVVRLATGNTDQGQGADQTLAQIVADVLSVAPQDVAVTSGDSAHAPYGGGAFGSRGTVQGGAAAYDAALTLRQRLLAAAALLLQRQPSELALRDGCVVWGEAVLMSLGELARTCQFKPHLFPAGLETGLTALGRHTPTADAMVSSVAFAATVSVDVATGAVSVGRLLIAHDGGTLINPKSVAGQLQGAMVQGLGQALMEAIRVDDAGQPLTGSFMDYAMPRADDTPDAEIIHLPAREDGFAPRGVGEAGTAGTPAAIFNALNDALAFAGCAVDTLPATPLRVWQALHSR